MKLLGLRKKDYRVRLGKLRSHLNILEKLMCSQHFADVNFSHLPAKAHRQNRKAFQRDCNSKKKETEARKSLHARYEEYLKDVQSGKAEIKSTGTQPHELIRGYLKGIPAKCGNFLKQLNVVYYVLQVRNWTPH